jgi:polyribonucleotide nucleotidyltransferase
MKTITATWISRWPVPVTVSPAFQLDLKIAGITEQIIRETLQQAREARARILQIMLQTIPRPRPEISKKRSQAVCAAD